MRKYTELGIDRVFPNFKSSLNSREFGVLDAECLVEFFYASVSRLVSFVFCFTLSCEYVAIELTFYLLGLCVMCNLRVVLTERVNNEY